MKNFKKSIDDEVDDLLSKPDQDDTSDPSNSSSFTIRELERALEVMITSNKSPDNHGVHPIMIKKVGTLFKDYLLELCNSVLTTQKWLWNVSKVIFIKKPKKPSYMDPGAYRPLSLNSYIGKTVERLMENRIRILAEKTGLLDAHQEGFRKKRSTHRYLYRLKSKLEQCKLLKKAVICMAIDFEKAFDSVWIKGLLYKLWHMGIKGKMWHLLAHMLLNRKINLYVNSYISDLICCVLGLPQGSILAPLLFILYIADMPTSGDLDGFKYADDMSLLSIADTLNNAAIQLQQHCQLLEDWCNKWRLTVNCKKGKTECIIMDFTNQSTSASIPVQFVPAITINNQEISLVEKSPVLGVLIDKDLNNVAQCNAVKAKLCYKWWQVKKYCNPNWGLKLKTVMIIVNATILPTLFYAAPSWLHTRKSLEVFNPLLYQMLTIACGSYYKPDRKTLECITGFVPLETQLSVISSKFLLKNFIQHVPDSLTCTITACAPLQKHFVSEHINNLKRYLAFSLDARSLNTIDLENDTVKAHKYTKASIDRYKSYCWNKTLSHNPPLSGIIPPSDLKVLNLPCSRKLESFIISLIHGHNILNQFRFNRSLTGSPLCLCLKSVQSLLTTSYTVR